MGIKRKIKLGTSVDKHIYFIVLNQYYISLDSYQVSCLTLSAVFMHMYIQRPVNIYRHHIENGP